MGDAVAYADVLDLARHGNVWMKLSGLGHFATDGPLYGSAKRFTRAAIDAFGPERLVWGGGTPSVVDAHLDREPEAERALVKGGNLARLLGVASGGGDHGPRWLMSRRVAPWDLPVLTVMPESAGAGLRRRRGNDR